MKQQQIILRNDAGETITGTFNDIEKAAKWCAEYPEYGITLELDNDGNCWDTKEWQDALDSAFIK
jgi:hypothetical protein